MSQPTAFELKQTIQAGGRVTVNAADYTAFQLQEMGHATRVRGGSVTVLQGEVLSSYEQEQVALSGATLYVDARPR